MYYLLFTLTQVIVHRLWRLLADVKHLISGADIFRLRLYLNRSDICCLYLPSLSRDTCWSIHACCSTSVYVILQVWHLQDFHLNMCTHLEAASPGPRCCSFPLILNSSLIKTQNEHLNRALLWRFPLLWSALVPPGFKVMLFTALLQVWVNGHFLAGGFSFSGQLGEKDGCWGGCWTMVSSFPWLVCA